MKNLILALFVIGAMANSCSNNGTAAETGDAQEVETVENAQTMTFATVKAGSHVDWRATHLGGVNPRFGKLMLTSAEFLVNGGELSNAKVVMDMSTITVENFPEGAEEKGELTGHLQAPDFFDVEQFATSTFELTGIAAGEGDFSSKVTGNLTIKGVTKSITFAANVSVSDNEVSIKSEDFSVDRSDWGLTYHAEGAEGVPVDYLIADDIGFTIDVTVTK